MVKVRYDEGLTNHIGPESFVAVREGGRQPLTGERAGQAIERRNIVLWGAHAFLTAEGNTAMTRLGEDHAAPRRQRPWHVRKSPVREPGDLHFRPMLPGTSHHAGGNQGVHPEHGGGGTLIRSWIQPAS